MKRTLFDDDKYPVSEKEDRPLNRLKNLDEKIADAVSRVKALKEENVVLERKIKELEAQLEEKSREIERISSEKTSIKNQVEDLLNELETIELG
jgi:chromosome segregation ATPase